MRRHHYQSRKDTCHYNHRVVSASLRCIDSLHAPEVADTLRSVAQVLAFIVDPECSLLVTQILLKLMLCRSVGAAVPREGKKDMVPVSSQSTGHYPLSRGFPYFSIRTISSQCEGASMEMAMRVRHEDPTPCPAHPALPCPHLSPPCPFFLSMEFREVGRGCGGRIISPHAHQQLRQDTGLQPMSVSEPSFPPSCSASYSHPLHPCALNIVFPKNLMRHTHQRLP